MLYKIPHEYTCVGFHKDDIVLPELKLLKLMVMLVQRVTLMDGAYDKFG